MVLNYGAVVNHQIPKFFSHSNPKNSGAPWYVSNKTLHEDFKIPSIQEVIKSNINRYKDRTTEHVNQLISDLFTQPLERKD